jgi:hypothetical protein
MTLTSLFHQLVRAAMDSQGIATSETTEFYLVQLLEGFARPRRADLLAPPLALDYLESFHLPASQRFGKLRRVADTSLFITGVFVDSLERSAVGSAYFIALGRSAYACLSNETDSSDLGASFDELSGRFSEFVRVLGQIGDQEIFRRDRDTIRLYKRWLGSRGEREAALLIRRGIIPVAPQSSRRH